MVVVDETERAVKVEEGERRTEGEQVKTEAAEGEVVVVLAEVAIEEVERKH